MSGTIRWALGLALALSVAVAAPAAAADTALDRLVGDLIATCAPSPTLQQLRRHYSNRFVPENKTPAVALAAALASLLGTPKVERGDGLVAVRVPISVTLRGLKVSELGFVIGIENGVATDMVTFAAPLDTVEAKFGDSVRRIRAKGVDGLEVLLESRGEGTDYICDRSM